MLTNFPAIRYAIHVVSGCISLSTISLVQDQTDGSLKQSTGSSSVAGAACINVVRKNRILDCDIVI